MAKKKKTTKKEAVVEEQETEALATTEDSMSFFGDDAPDWLKEAAGGSEGFECVDKEDVILPRIVLLQPTPPPDIDYDEMDHLKPGMMINHLTREVLAGKDEELLIIPIKMQKTRAYMRPRKDGGGIICRSFDSHVAFRPDGEDMEGNQTDQCEHCVHAKFDMHAEQPAPKCQKFMSFLCILPDHGMQMISLSMKSTQIKVAKRILSALMSTGRKMYAHRVRIRSVRDENEKGKFYNFAFRPGGKGEERFPSQEEFQQAQSIYDSFAKGDKKVILDVADSEVAEAPVEDDGDVPF